MDNEWHRQYMARWRKRRKDAGLPAYYRPSKRPTYKATPENRERRAQYMREYRQRKDAGIKASCRMVANQALKQGLIPVSKCTTCGSDKAEMHHADYSQPLAVEWLCKRCHAQLHRKAIYITSAKGLST